MLIMKKGMPAKSGKTTEALQKVVELLSKNQSVLYVNNDHTYHDICKKLEELVGQNILNKFYFSDGYRLEDLLSEIIYHNYISDDLRSASIVIDIGEDVSDLECEQDLYVYYQTPRENNLK